MGSLAAGLTGDAAALVCDLGAVGTGLAASALVGDTTTDLAFEVTAAGFTGETDLAGEADLAGETALTGVGVAGLAGDAGLVCFAGRGEVTLGGIPEL